MCVDVFVDIALVLDVFVDIALVMHKLCVLDVFVVLFMCLVMLW
jgi:hypothetical protein